MILEKILGSLFVRENIGISRRNFIAIENEVNSHVTQINNLNAQASKWRRIDTLSAPVEITSTDAMNPNILPISEAYVNSKVYAVEFLLINPDGRISQFAIFGGYSGGSTGGLVVGGNVNAIYTVSKIRTSNSNTIGFYGKSGVGTLGTLYFYKCYVVKESLS